MKERLDVLLTKLDGSYSREKAKAVIMSGSVFVDNQRIDKPGTQVDTASVIEIRQGLEFVSRGGYKLKRAIEEFGIDLNGKKCMDVGASTGGFTDCMLKNGADTVIAIDVGYGQLDYRLRNDDRVLCMERTNIRNVVADMLPYLPDFVSVDVSFISLTKVLPVIKALMQPGFEMVCLIKPQFEAGKAQVGKNGVVRDKTVQANVIFDVAEFATRQGLYINGIDYSPIKGPKGNIEFLIYLSDSPVSEYKYDLHSIKQLVDIATDKAE